MRQATARIERDALLYFVGKAGAAVGMLAAIGLATRGLGAAAFAEFALWSAVALWSATASVGWLQTGIGRLHRERRAGSRFAGYLASVRVALWLGAATAGSFAASLTALLSAQGPATALAFGAMAASTALFMGHQAVALADLEARRVGRSDLVRGVALPVATAIAILLGGLDVTTAALAHAFAMMAAVMVLPAVASARKDPPMWAELRPLARYGIPIGVWSVICLGNAQLGRAALEIAGDPEALGLYAGLQDVVVKCGTLLLMPVVSAIHGHAMALWAQGDHVAMKSGLRRAFVMQAGIGVVVILVAFVLGERLALLLFGAELPRDSATLVTVLLASGVVAANMGLVAHKGLELVHATGVMVGCAVVALGFDALVCALVVPQYGAVGAAGGFAASQVVYAGLALVCSRRSLATRIDSVPNRAASRSGRTATTTL